MGDPVPRAVVLNLDEAFRVLEALENARLTVREGHAAPGSQEQAMYERKPPRVKLEDGTLGVPADALDNLVLH